MFASLSFSIAQIPQIEKQALYSIAESVKSTYNWNEQTPVEQWKGVTITNVGGNDHVTGLDMYIEANGTNYSVNFSSQISVLNYLEELTIKNELPLEIKFNFDFNHLLGLNRLVSLNLMRTRYNANNDVFLNVGRLAQLTNLENLRIDYYNANLKLPTNISSIAKLKNLFYKNLNDNTFTKEVFQNTSIEELTLLTKAFSVEDPSNAVLNMKKLKSLTIQGNFFSLPAGFYAISNLEKLSISSPNYILTDEIDQYSDRLKSFTLKEVSSIQFPVIGNLVNLEELILQSDHIDLGSYIKNLTKLKSLYVESEYPVFLTPEISQLTTLTNLYYQSFGLTNEVIYTIPNLKFLLLYTNQNISENIANLTKLENLQVSSRENFSELPPAVGNMTSLKTVDFLSYAANTKTLAIPENYFTNWVNLTQFWTWHQLDGDITNRFLNNPNLEVLSFQPIGSGIGPLKGKLNICQNPKIDFLDVIKNNIQEVDLRNMESLTKNTTRRFYLIQNNVSKFIVDDVDHFNSLVNSGKIIIQTNAPNGYTVETSSEPCQKPLAQSNVQLEKTMLYPNPVKDVLTFKTDKTVENVELISVSGQKFNVEVYNNRVNLSNLPAGMYMIKWSEAGFYKLQKILKK